MCRANVSDTVVVCARQVCVTRGRKRVFVSVCQRACFIHHRYPTQHRIRSAVHATRFAQALRLVLSGRGVPGRIISGRSPTRTAPLRSLQYDNEFKVFSIDSEGTHGCKPIVLNGISTTSFARRQVQQTRTCPAMPSVRSTTQQQQHPQRPHARTHTTRPLRRPTPSTPPLTPNTPTPATPAAQQLSSPTQQHKAFPFVNKDVLRPIDGLHRPVGLVVLSALLLETAVQLTGVGPGVPLLAAGVGASVGGLYAGLNRVGVKRLWTAPAQPLNVVITGSTKGIGKALAREFLRCVAICCGWQYIVHNSYQQSW